MERCHYSVEDCSFEEALETLMERFGLSRIEAGSLLGQAKKRSPTGYPRWEHATVDTDGTLTVSREDLHVQALWRAPTEFDRDGKPIGQDRFALGVTIRGLDPPWPLE